MCGYEVRTSCEVSPSVTSDGTASVSTVEAVCIFINNITVIEIHYTSTYKYIDCRQR